MDVVCPNVEILFVKTIFDTSVGIAILLQKLKFLLDLCQRFILPLVYFCHISCLYFHVIHTGKRIICDFNYIIAKYWISKS